MVIRVKIYYYNLDGVNKEFSIDLYKNEIEYLNQNSSIIIYRDKLNNYGYDVYRASKLIKEY